MHQFQVNPIKWTIQLQIIYLSNPSPEIAFVDTKWFILVPHFEQFPVNIYFWFLVTTPFKFLGICFDLQRIQYIDFIFIYLN